MGVHLSGRGTAAVPQKFTPCPSSIPGIQLECCTPDGAEFCSSEHRAKEWHSVQTALREGTVGQRGLPWESV